MKRIHFNYMNCKYHLCWQWKSSEKSRKASRRRRRRRRRHNSASDYLANRLVQIWTKSDRWSLWNTRDLPHLSLVSWTKRIFLPRNYSRPKHTFLSEFSILRCEVHTAKARISILLTFQPAFVRDVICASRRRHRRRRPDVLLSPRILDGDLEWGPVLTMLGCMTTTCVNCECRPQNTELFRLTSSVYFLRGKINNKRMRMRMRVRGGAFWFIKTARTNKQ